MKTPVALEHKTIPQTMECVGAQGDASHKIEAGIAVTRFEQPRQRFEKIPFAEIVQARLFLGERDELSSAGPGLTESGLTQNSSAPIHEPHQAWRLILLQGRARSHVP
jgi:hypothetical protein